ncbi:MAG: agmatine deiminase family protein [Vicinamibacteria bacterium]|nr:agmatine deiminase family protein [Vicinamibacteria bacterium]
MPAEWHPHAATWMAWPHDDEQWVGMLEPVRREFASLVDAIATREPVDLLLADDESEQDARRRLTRGTTRFHRVAHQDLWLRDSGPIFVTSGDQVALVDWEFNGWGDKYPADLDNQIPTHVARILGDVPLYKPGIVMEGGSIEGDGHGTVLTTRQCLLSPHRNPWVSEADLEGHLREAIGATQVLWLDEGLEGDHTDGHIDTIARFAGPDTIVTATCDDRDDPNHAVLLANLERLRTARAADQRPYRIVELPIPVRKAHFEGERLPLTYANFYIVNDAVLLPVFGDEHDANAAEILRPLFPGREIVPLMARALMTGGGAFHCVTQQQPAGRLWRPE